MLLLGWVCFRGFCYGLWVGFVGSGYAILFGRWVAGGLGGLPGLFVGGFVLGWFDDFAVLVVL